MAVVVAAVTLSSDESGGPSAGPPSSTAPSSAPMTRVLPSQVLPTEQQLKNVTLLDLARHGDVVTTVYPDGKTDPPTCSLVSRPSGTTIVGRALSVAGAAFRDRPGDDYGATAYSYVAVFGTGDTARIALQKLGEAAETCPAFTDVSPSKTDDPKPRWTVADVKVTDHDVMWNANEQTSDDTPWVCAKAARAENNVLVLATLCAPNPADGATKIIDIIVDNINAKR